MTADSNEGLPAGDRSCLSLERMIRCKQQDQTITNTELKYEKRFVKIAKCLEEI